MNDQALACPPTRHPPRPSWVNGPPAGVSGAGTPVDDEDDPELAACYRGLAEVNEAIANLYW